MATKIKTKSKRWHFLWCDEESPPKNGDCHAWKSKTFRVSTFEKAMDKMLNFVRGKPFVCLVDYECAALHEPYSQKRHTKCFPRIDMTEHELTEYLG